MKVIPTLAATILLASCASVAQAQAALPFHPGQWAVQADANGDSGGLLRFITPQTALLLRGEGRHSSMESESANGSPSSSSYNVVSLSLGVRRHRALAPNLASTFEAGLAGGWTRQTTNDGSPFGPQRSRVRVIGPFVAVGAQYLVGGHLGIGAAYELSASWGKVRYADANNNSRESARSYGAGFRPIYATLYF